MAEGESIPVKTRGGFEQGLVKVKVMRRVGIFYVDGRDESDERDEGL